MCVCVCVRVCVCACMRVCVCKKQVSREQREPRQYHVISPLLRLRRGHLQRPETADPAAVHCHLFRRWLTEMSMSLRLDQVSEGASEGVSG